MAVLRPRDNPIYCHHSGTPLHARTPRAGRMTLFRQVSWLAGHCSSPPSRFLLCKSQWHLEKGSPPTVAGAASDLACRQSTANLTEFPLGWSISPAHLNSTIATRHAL